MMEYVVKVHTGTTAVYNTDLLLYLYRSVCVSAEKLCVPLPHLLCCAALEKSFLC